MVFGNGAVSNSHCATVNCQTSTSKCRHVTGHGAVEECQHPGAIPNPAAAFASPPSYGAVSYGRHAAVRDATAFRSIVLIQSAVVKSHGAKIQNAATRPRGTVAGHDGVNDDQGTLIVNAASAEARAVFSHCGVG
jgi:hypothetical protein